MRRGSASAFAISSICLSDSAILFAPAILSEYPPIHFGVHLFGSRVDAGGPSSGCVDPSANAASTLSSRNPRVFNIVAKDFANHRR
jgi:hypothetical protein